MTQRRQGGFLVGMVHRLSGRVFARKLKAHGLDGLSPAQGRILFVLWQEDDLPMGELAGRTGLGKSTLTSMLDRLEAAGYVERRPSPGDRRQVLVHLAEDGGRLRDSYESVSQEMLGVFYAGLSAEQIDEFERTLTHILANLSDPSEDAG